MDVDQYCRDKGTPPGSDEHYSLLSQSGPRRRRLTALYALAREINDISLTVHESAVAHTKLAWWRGELERLYESEARHPITQALQPHLADTPFTAAHFGEFCDGVKMDLDWDLYTSADQLLHYANRRAHLALLLAEGMACQQKITAAAAQEFGVMWVLAERLLNVRSHALKGRITIPEEELAAFGVVPEQLRTTQASAALVALFRHQAERIRERHRRALAYSLGADRRRLRPLRIRARLLAALLDEVEAEGFALLQRRIELTPLRKLWLAWRTA